ncbi:MAG: HAMP domain-containing sensor histidine kinase [Microscillaceae bacterium]|nr:HAMP domain-containing sensor histidine kinase [Microscillaceae bacterium]
MKITIPTAGFEKEDQVENIEILAHDLRGPIHSISGLVELLKLELKDCANENIIHCLNLIDQNCKHSHELLSKVLDVVRLGDKPGKLIKENENLVDIIHRLLELQQISASSRGVHLSFTYGNELVMGKVDKTYLIHAIENLLTNAIKFTEKEGEVSVLLYESDENIYIKVMDNGIGICEDDLPFIFDKFTKIRRNGLRGEESTGLGMSITQQIIEAHGGEISVKSKVNEGTTFSIILPKN